MVGFIPWFCYSWIFMETILATAANLGLQWDSETTVCNGACADSEVIIVLHLLHWQMKWAM